MLHLNIFELALSFCIDIFIIKDTLLPKFITSSVVGGEPALCQSGLATEPRASA